MRRTLIVSVVASITSATAAGAQPAAAPEHFRTAGAWWFADFTLAPVVRHADGDLALQLALGGTVEALLGADEMVGTRLPLRLGPFVTLTATPGDRTGAQAAGGLTALVSGARSPFHPIGPAVLVSVGALLDLPPDAARSMGGLGRISYGVTTSGRRRWKAFSDWVFLEGHWIAAAGDGTARQEILLGLRAGPLGFPLILVPNFDE